jgi:hypothetical protein
LGKAREKPGPEGKTPVERQLPLFLSLLWKQRAPHLLHPEGESPAGGFSMPLPTAITGLYPVIDSRVDPRVRPKLG